MWKLRGRGRPIRQKTLINHKQYPFKSKKTLSYAYTLTFPCLMVYTMFDKQQVVTPGAVCLLKLLVQCFVVPHWGFWPFCNPSVATTLLHANSRRSLFQRIYGWAFTQVFPSHLPPSLVILFHAQPCASCASPAGNLSFASRPDPVPASSTSHLKEPLRTTPQATRNKYKKHKMSETSL